MQPGLSDCSLPPLARNVQPPRHLRSHHRCSDVRPVPPRRVVKHVCRHRVHALWAWAGERTASLVTRPCLVAPGVGLPQLCTCLRAGGGSMLNLLSPPSCVPADHHQCRARRHTVQPLPRRHLQARQLHNQPVQQVGKHVLTCVSSPGPHALAKDAAQAVQLLGQAAGPPSSAARLILMGASVGTCLLTASPPSLPPMATHAFPQLPLWLRNPRGRHRSIQLHHVPPWVLRSQPQHAPLPAVHPWHVCARRWRQGVQAVRGGGGDGTAPGRCPHGRLRHERNVLHPLRPPHFPAIHLRCQHVHTLPRGEGNEARPGSQRVYRLHAWDDAAQAR